MQGLERILVITMDILALVVVHVAAAVEATFGNEILLRSLA